MSKALCLITVCFGSTVMPLSAQTQPVVVSFSGHLGTLQTTGDFGDRVGAGPVLGAGAEILVHPHVSLLIGVDLGLLDEDAGIVPQDPVPLGTVSSARADVGTRSVTATRLLGGVGFHLTNQQRSRVVVRPSAQFGIQLFDFESDDTISAAISGGLTLGYDVSRTVTLLATVRADASFVDEGSFSVSTEQVLMVPIMIGASIRLD